MVEPETRRFLLKNRLGKYVEPLEREARITDLHSLEMWCADHAVEDIERLVGMKPIQARTLLDLMTNTSHPRSPRAAGVANPLSPHGGLPAPGLSPAQKKNKPKKFFDESGPLPLGTRTPDGDPTARLDECDPAVKRFLIANKLGQHALGLADMGLCTMESLSEFCTSKAGATAKLQAAPLKLAPRAAKEFVDLMTNERNPKSPRALAKFRVDSAAAASRAQEEAEVARVAREKALKRKEVDDALKAAASKRLERESAELLKKAQEDAYNDAEAVEKRRVEEEASAAGRLRRAKEEKLERDKALSLAKANRILELQEERQRQLALNSKAKEVAAQRKHAKEVAELSPHATKIQNLARGKLGQKAALDRKMQLAATKSLQGKMRVRHARKETSLLRLKVALTADAQLAEQGTSSLRFRVEALAAAVNTAKRVFGSCEGAPSSEGKTLCKAAPWEGHPDASPVIARADTRLNTLLEKQRGVVQRLKLLSGLQTWDEDWARENGFLDNAQPDGNSGDDGLSSGATTKQQQEVEARLRVKLSLLETEKAKAVSSEDFAKAQAVKLEIEEAKKQAKHESAAAAAAAAEGLGAVEVDLDAPSTSSTSSSFVDDAVVGADFYTLSTAHAAAPLVVAATELAVSARRELLALPLKFKQLESVQLHIEALEKALSEAEGSVAPNHFASVVTAKNKLRALQTFFKAEEPKKGFEERRLRQTVERTEQARLSAIDSEVKRMEAEALRVQQEAEEAERQRLKAVQDEKERVANELRLKKEAAEAAKKAEEEAEAARLQALEDAKLAAIAEAEAKEKARLGGAATSVQGLQRMKRARKRVGERKVEVAEEKKAREKELEEKVEAEKVAAREAEEKAAKAKVAKGKAEEARARAMAAKAKAENLKKLRLATLKPGEVIEPGGRELISPNQAFKVVLQPNGNLEVLEVGGGGDGESMKQFSACDLKPEGWGYRAHEMVGVEWSLELTPQGDLVVKEDGNEESPRFSSCQVGGYEVSGEEQAEGGDGMLWEAVVQDDGDFVVTSKGVLKFSSFQVNAVSVAWAAKGKSGGDKKKGGGGDDDKSGGVAAATAAAAAGGGGGVAAMTTAEKKELKALKKKKEAGELSGAESKHYKALKKRRVAELGAQEGESAGNGSNSFSRDPRGGDGGGDDDGNDDGKEQAEAEALASAAAGPFTKYKQGQVVYGCFRDDGEWYEATVLSVTQTADGSCSYDLEYNGFDDSEKFEKGKPEDEVASPEEFENDGDGEDEEHETQTGGKARRLSTVEEKRARSQSTNLVDGDAGAALRYKVGDTVYACLPDDGEWYEAKVLAVVKTSTNKTKADGFTVDVEYLGFEDHEKFERGKALSEVCTPEEFDGNEEEEEAGTAPQRRLSTSQKRRASASNAPAAATASSAATNGTAVYSAGQTVYGCYPDDGEWYEAVVKKVHPRQTEKGSAGPKVYVYDLEYDGFDESEKDEFEKPESEIASPAEFEEETTEHLEERSSKMQERRASQVLSPDKAETAAGAGAAGNDGAGGGGTKEAAAAAAASFSADESAKAKNSVQSLVQDRKQTMNQKLEALAAMDQSGELSPLGPGALNSARKLVLSAPHLHRDEGGGEGKEEPPGNSSVSFASDHPTKAAASAGAKAGAGSPDKKKSSFLGMSLWGSKKNK